MIRTYRARTFKPRTVRWRGSWWSCDVASGYAAIMTAAGYCHIGPERLIASLSDADPRVMSIDEAIEREVLRPWGTAGEKCALQTEADWRAEVYHLNGGFQCVDYFGDLDSVECARFHVDCYRGAWIEGDPQRETDPKPEPALFEEEG